jgi:crossover junction endodeoxyribonuclease RuvC
MIIAGIDPGMTGAMVILFPDNSTIVCRVPLMKKGKVQPAWSEWSWEWSYWKFHGFDRVVIEQVSAMPEQGSASGFNFGRSYGFVHALSIQFNAPIHFVTPAAWKGKLGLLKADKNASREEARRLMPSITPEVARVKDDGVAEAALLAYYGRKYL